MALTFSSSMSRSASRAYVGQSDRPSATTHSTRRPEKPPLLLISSSAKISPSIIDASLIAMGPFLEWRMPTLIGGAARPRRLGFHQTASALKTTSRIAQPPVPHEPSLLDLCLALVCNKMERDTRYVDGGQTRPSFELNVKNKMRNP